MSRPWREIYRTVFILFENEGMVRQLASSRDWLAVRRLGLGDTGHRPIPAAGHAFELLRVKTVRYVASPIPPRR